MRDILSLYCIVCYSLLTALQNCKCEFNQGSPALLHFWFWICVTEISSSCMTFLSPSIHHSSEIRVLCLMKWPSHFHFVLLYFFVDIDIREKSSTKWKIEKPTLYFRLYKNMANFEVLSRPSRVISSSINLSFLKSATIYIYAINFSNCY